MSWQAQVEEEIADMEAGRDALSKHAATLHAREREIRRANPHDERLKNIAYEIDLLDEAYDLANDAIIRSRRIWGLDDAEDTHALWQAANRVPLSAR